jgi:hypothetical protein
MKRAIPYLSLTETVNQYMLASMNDRRKYFVNYLSHARWIWKRLSWSTLWTIKNKYVEVDRSTTPHSVIIPKDLVRFINLSSEDNCHNLRSLTFNDGMSVLTPPALSDKCCPVCDEPDDLSQLFTNISVSFKDRLIDNVVRTEKIWKKLCSNGDIVEVREIPVKNYNSTNPLDFEIGTTVIETFICKLEKKPCGCVAKTESNKDLIVSTCGVLLPCCQKNLCHPLISKANARFGSIKIQDGRIFIKGECPEQLLLSYQTNGECGEDEIMIPEHAVEAVIFGIDYRAKALAPNFDRFEKRESERAYNKAKMELEEFLNPIYAVEFMNAQMAFPLWGSNSDQTEMRKDHCENQESIAQSQGISVDDIGKLIDNKLKDVVVKEGDTIINANCNIAQDEW